VTIALARDRLATGRCRTGTEARRRPSPLTGVGNRSLGRMLARLDRASEAPVGSRCSCGGTVLPGGECSKCLTRRLRAEGRSESEIGRQVAARAALARMAPVGRLQRAVVTGGNLGVEERAVDLRSSALADDERLQQAFDNRPPMRLGEEGEAVATLQQAFLDLGFLMPRSTDNGAKPPDGIFGIETSRVVKGFQFRQAIAQDAVVGRQTLGELDGLLAGDSPPGSVESSAPESVAVTAREVSPQRFDPCGVFDWEINWETTGRNGYLVQEIVNTFAPTLCGEGPGLDPTTPHYWEAWRVQGDGRIGPNASDRWSRPDMPGHSGTWTMTGRVFWVDQLDLEDGWQVANVPDAGNLWSTTTEPGNLGPELLRRSAGGVWDCCGETRTHVPLPAAQEEPASDVLAAVDQQPDPLAGYTQCDFLDERISTAGQQALYALYKRGGRERFDAVSMLGAVRSELLQGILKADEQVPALIALRHGTTWWEIVPAGQGAIVFEPETPPVMIFRPGLATDREALATALDRAWESSTTGTLAVVIPPPSGQPCPINLAPVVVEGERPQPGGGKAPACVDTILWESLFPAWQAGCDIDRSNLEMACALQHSWCTFFPDLCDPRCVELSKTPRAESNERCVVDNAMSLYMVECGIPAGDFGAPREAIRKRYRAWLGS
jgi:peptidoglycan hydrolase-like protein with peptidoglycan-binding domain